MAATELAATSTVMSPKLDYDENDTLDIEKMSEILLDFYEHFNNDTNYLLIGLYIPVIFIAMTANILVIVIVFKYQYMRRYESIFLVAS